MAVMLWMGQVLVRNGSVAVDPACCCTEEPPCSCPFGMSIWIDWTWCELSGTVELTYTGLCTVAGGFGVWAVWDGTADVGGSTLRLKIACDHLSDDSTWGLRFDACTYPADWDYCGTNFGYPGDGVTTGYIVVKKCSETTWPFSVGTGAPPSSCGSCIESFDMVIRVTDP